MTENQPAKRHLLVTVPAVTARVKGGYSKIYLKILALIAFLCATIGVFSLPARAEDPNALTILNAQRVLTFLDSTVPEGVPFVVDQIAKGTMRRLVAEQPIWIMDASSGVIMYYQGEPGFTGQEASRLVDDRGQRFGLKAVENARAARSTWLSVVMAQSAYRAYCANKYPYVVCSLNPHGSPVDQQVIPRSESRAAAPATAGK